MHQAPPGTLTPHQITLHFHPLHSQHLLVESGVASFGFEAKGAASWSRRHGID